MTAGQGRRSRCVADSRRRKAAREQHAADRKRRDHDAQIRQFVERAALEHREQSRGVDGAAGKSHTEASVFSRTFVAWWDR
jgi:hypothetical protein